ncbi:hypothetical protein [Pseudonocardia cypriaca]|uniref:Uncharacterized protein n=1 Tax=Pseudonocardia cypriaca TaxID=882449 RepID=A0A543GCV7_9PSEU|nr:hypothetical protein [Pseudonocardia cypriaca]TQM43906.1 hypothetical protein FB388_1262 [Pseudonocardia cypriaca]
MTSAASRQHDHTLTYNVLGAFLPPDVEAGAAANLARTLREIDEQGGYPPF